MKNEILNKAKEFVIKHIKSLSRYNYVTILINVIVFYLLQYLFFNIILSKLFNDIIINKVNIVKYLMERNEAINLIATNAINSDYEETKEYASKEYEIRRKNNIKLVISFIIIPIVILTILLIVFIFYKRKNITPWNITDTISIILIFIAYLTEIYFLFMIVKVYNHVGDHTLIYGILNQIL